MADAMTPGPFPSELVEAAEAAIIAADKQASPVGDPNVMLASEEAQARAVLAAVLPRIEQRVIDRLAREAGEPPDEIPYVPGEVRGDTIWKRGVACGVAAERARWEDARSLLEAIARASDPGSENASDEAWRFAYENASESAAQVLAALAPERTTGEDDARLRAAFDEVCDELDREGT